MGARSFIQLPPDGQGKRLLTKKTEDGQDEIQIVAADETPTFYAVFSRIAPAANKYMATLWNGAAGRALKVFRVITYNWNWTAVTGIVLEQYLARITARTAGTAVAIKSFDTADALSAGVTASTGDTAATEDHIMRRFAATGEEVKLGALTLENLLGIPWPEVGDVLNAYNRPGSKPMVLRQNQGLAIRNVTSSTIGSCSYVIEFTDEST